MLFPVALFASLLVLQQTAPAPQTPATAPAQATTVAPRSEAVATPAEPAVTCRMETVTGSRFGRRVCRNVAQTADEAAQTREMLRRMQGARVPDS